MNCIDKDSTGLFSVISGPDEGCTGVHCSARGRAGTAAQRHKSAHCISDSYLLVKTS